MKKDQADRSRTMFLIPCDEGDMQIRDRQALSFRKKALKKLSGVKTCRNTDMFPVMLEGNSQRFLVQNTPKLPIGDNQKNDSPSRLFSMKYDLQLLGYREKISLVESIIKQSRQLSQKYGYFYITITMIHYRPNLQKKVSVWIHPDIKFKRPLHPIIKGTDFEKQIKFIVSLKNTLKEIFPTLDLGLGRTFFKLLFHIEQMKKKNKQQPLQNGHPRTPFLKKNRVEAKSGTISQKKISAKRTADNIKTQQSQDKRSFSYRFSHRAPPQAQFVSNFTLVQKKESMSTMLSQMVGNGYKEEIPILRIPKLRDNQQDNKKMFKKHSERSKIYKDYDQVTSLNGENKKANKQKPEKKHCSLKGSQEDQLEKSSKDSESGKATMKDQKHSILFPQQQKLLGSERRSNSPNVVRRSRSGGRMTISALMELEVENLFSDDCSGSGFYGRRSNDDQRLKNSEILHIQEDFQGLFA